MFAKLFSVIHSALGRPQVTTLRGPVGAVNTLSISPGGNLLASGGKDIFLKLPASGQSHDFCRHRRD